MKPVKILIITTFILMSYGCSTYKPYAQNPYNLYARIPRAVSNNPGKVSDSAAFRSGSLALAAGSRSIPGALPTNAAVGIAAASLLLSGPSRPLLTSEHPNYLSAALPVTEAADEVDAQIKIGRLVEAAVIHALSPSYKTKIVEYDDHYLFGRVLRPRWFRVDGPLCENWSCQVIAPIPTASALQWAGKIRKGRTTTGSEVYVYGLPKEQTIGFVKIKSEYDKDGLFSGSKHFVEGYELPDFKYGEFFRAVYSNLPPWIKLVTSIE